MENKKPFEIILHVGRITNLQSRVAKKSCHGQTLINECSISDNPSNFEGYKLIPISMRNISEVINKSSTSAFNYWDNFR